MDYDYRKYRERLPNIQNSKLRTQATYLLEFVQHLDLTLCIADKVLGPNQAEELPQNVCLLFGDMDNLRAKRQEALSKLDKIFDS